MKKLLITMTVNDEQFDLMVRPNETLTETLRERLGLTGVKEGCAEGVCGACAVLMDQHPVRACLTLSMEADGTSITTIEGLASDGKLHHLQESFINHGAVQCGFCTPGMIMVSKALLDEKPSPTDDEIKEALSGNLCRCTGYKKILEAVRSTTQIDPKKGA
ncbi:MAG: (2Fe-2S)-binding protein [Deltaproteobacteria bacterium]|nr:(2Fe-2S)-binding protein [Deltaproteobacteria bacterium]